ncbi:hypothetical protein [Sandaracinus amylolyticus]|uniref:hypothetical protein n=1 Tax=Sandaracinus amylolyticus TaxID=927083 RepID=UPI001F3F753E|nr:hypothetical protein [Sandaracinus amylolyticus]UJR86625.1 Hypothetical protein I5071_87260 [Sandaracinus amylolyticus]
MTWLVRSAIIAMYPRTDALPGAEDCDIDEFLRRFRRETTFLMWLGIVAGAWVFHWTPILTVFVPLPAFLLPAGLRDKHAYRITTTNLYLIRQAVFLLKLAAGLCWGGHPEIRKRFALPVQPADPGTFRTSGDVPPSALATSREEMQRSA